MHGLHRHFSVKNLTPLLCVYDDKSFNAYTATVIVDAADAVREKHRFTSLIHAIKYFMWLLFMLNPHSRFDNDVCDAMRGEKLFCHKSKMKIFHLDFEVFLVVIF